MTSKRKVRAKSAKTCQPTHDTRETERLLMSSYITAPTPAEAEMRMISIVLTRSSLRYLLKLSLSETISESTNFPPSE